MKMKIIILMTPEGQEAQALGRDLHSWHFSSQLVRDGQDGVIAENYIKVGEFEAKLPTVEQAAKNAAAYLRQRVKDTRAEAYEAVTGFEVRMNNLLALPAPETRNED